MKRWLFFGYGVGCHGLFFATFGYMAGFVGNFLVPKSIDTPAATSTAVAVAIDVLLLSLFAAQHSIMARPAFKRAWTRIVPTPVERSTYVLISCLVTVVMMWQWQGIDTIIWDVHQPIGRAILWGLFAIGWLLVPAVSFMLDHFDLFGTRQVWFYLHRREYRSSPFQIPLLYKRVRHPLYIGWAIAFWAIPALTAGHLLFAGLLTAYMAAAAIVEERDLVAHFGREYEDYRRRVPMFVPSLRAATTASFQETRTSEATAHRTYEEKCNV